MISRGDNISLDILFINLKYKIMSYMSWIAQMVSDNTYHEFKDLYIKAHENNQESFIFGGENVIQFG